MRKSFLPIALLCLFSRGWASNGGWDIGSLFTRTVKYSTERALTHDTITAGESGKIFSVYCPSIICEFELPIAQPGMKFSFNSQLLKSFSVDPATTDTIRWCNPMLSAGQKLTSTGATYDSITIYSSEPNYWTVENIRGVFENGGS